MMYESLIVALLATSAIAYPQHHHKHHRFHGSGTGAPFPLGTGAPFPAGNSTGPFSNTTGTGVAPALAPLETTTTVNNVVTVTVVPLPVSSEAVAADAPSSVDVNNQAVTDSPATCGAPQSTTTVTTTQVVTVTIDESVASTPASDDSAASSSSSSSAVEVIVSYSTSTVAPSSTEASSATVEAAVFAAVSSTSSAAAATVSSSSGTSSSGKRGLAYNDVSLTDFWSGTPVSWAYNWAATSGGTVGAGLEYVPMAWCSGTISKEDWTEAANTAIASGSSHLLGFNEPDQVGQCNIAAADAAAGHIDYMNQFSGKAAIGSPAVTNGEGTMGLNYLSSFLDSCAGQCVVDFLNIHWYGSIYDGVVQNFKDHVTSAIELASNNSISKVWVTEFALDGASAADTVSFLDEVLPWLDSQEAVERYAFFMCKDGSLTSGSAISSDIGAAYVA